MKDTFVHYNTPIMKRLLFLGVFLVSMLSSYAQVGTDNPAQAVITNEKDFQKRYEKNIKKTRINGVYIPKDLEDAYKELADLSGAASVAKFKSAPEEVIARKLHFGLGRWISINWNLEEGSRYEKYLRDLGLVKVDDMMQFTIVSWHRHLNGLDQEMEQRIKIYQERVEKELAERRERSQVIKKEKRAIKKGG